MGRVLIALAALLAFTAAESHKKIVCYFDSMAMHRLDNGRFEISNIDPRLCTHLIYMFVGLNENGDIIVMDRFRDLPDNYGEDSFSRFNELRTMSPKTKTLIAIGARYEGSAIYSPLVSSPELRKRFINNAIDFVKEHRFNGLDIFWEYPNQNGGDIDDKMNFVSLLKELRKRVDDEGLILSAALIAAEQSAKESYIISEVSKYLHFINLVAYNVRTAWDRNTRLNAPLYRNPLERKDVKSYDVDSSVKYWISQGAERKKIVVGVPFFGISFVLDNKNDSGIGAPAQRPGPPALYTKQIGFFGFNEICESLMTGTWKIVVDVNPNVPYAVRDRVWISFDNVESVTAKAKYVIDSDLGGIMIGTIDTDDFDGYCGVVYPLLNTVNNIINNSTSSNW